MRAHLNQLKDTLSNGSSALLPYPSPISYSSQPPKRQPAGHRVCGTHPSRKSSRLRPRARPPKFLLAQTSYSRLAALSRAPLHALPAWTTTNRGKNHVAVRAEHTTKRGGQDVIDKNRKYLNVCKKFYPSEQAKNDSSRSSGEIRERMLEDKLE
jgi:hypothetical protein